VPIDAWISPSSLIVHDSNPSTRTALPVPPGPLFVPEHEAGGTAPERGRRIKRSIERRHDDERGSVGPLTRQQVEPRAIGQAGIE